LQAGEAPCPTGAGTSYAQRPFEDPSGNLWLQVRHALCRGRKAALWYALGVGRIIDIYGGKDPRILPRYSIAEAAQYVRVPVTTLAMWVRGRGRYGAR